MPEPTMTADQSPAKARPTPGDHVGFIGLGAMGRPMASWLARRGEVTVHLWARHAAQTAGLAADGAVIDASARAVASACTVVILMVPGMPEIEAVLAGDDGLLAGVRDHLLLAISSTVAPGDLRALADRLTRDTGGTVRVVDAPVSGGPEGATDATLAIMVGGAEADVAVVLPLYATMGTPVHLGPLGAGQVAKACNQIIVAGTLMAVAEATTLAERAGLDVGALVALLQRGYAGSTLLRVKGERFVTHNYTPAGAAKYLVKDLDGALAEARRVGLTTPLTALADDTYRALTAAGLGDQDSSVVQAYLASART